LFFRFLCLQWFRQTLTVIVTVTQLELACPLFTVHSLHFR